MHPARVALFSLVLCAACDGGNSGPRSIVSGTWFSHYASEAGTRQVPADLSDVNITATVGGEKVNGKGRSDGSFEVYGVPEGEMTLKVGDYYFVTTSHNLQLGGLFWRDTTAVEAQSSSTQLSLSLNGLLPWQTDDALELLVQRSGTFVFYLGDALQLTAGQTSTSSRAFAWQDYAYPSGYLIRSTDKVTIAHLAAKNVSGVRVRTLAKAATLQGISMSDGSTSSMTATLTDVPQTSSFTFDFPLSQYQSYAPSELRDEGHWVSYQAVPEELATGSAAGADLVWLDGASASDEGGSATVNYGDPYPADWTRYVSAGKRYSITYSLSGQSVARSGSIGVESKSGTSLSPMVSPVRNLGFSGSTISWSAPSLAAGVYRVNVHRLYRDENGELTSNRVAMIYTRGNGVTLPAGVLVSGQSYYVFVRALSAPFPNPERRTFPNGWADAASVLYTHR